MAALFYQPDINLDYFLDPAGTEVGGYLHHINSQFKMDYVALWHTM